MSYLRQSVADLPVINLYLAANGATRKATGHIAPFTISKNDINGYNCLARSLSGGQTIQYSADSQGIVRQHFSRCAHGIPHPF